MNELLNKGQNRFGEFEIFASNVGQKAHERFEAAQNGQKSSKTASCERMGDEHVNCGRIVGRFGHNRRG